MVELFETVEKTRQIQEAIKLLVDADQDQIDMLPPLYREKAMEIRERFGDETDREDESSE